MALSQRLTHWHRRYERFWPGPPCVHSYLSLCELVAHLVQEMAGNWGLIDLDTPKDVYTKASYTKGVKTEFQLVVCAPAIDKVL